MNRIQKNYNGVFWLVFASLLISLLTFFSVVIFILMYRDVNYNNNINTNNQIVNVNTMEEVERININTCSLEALQSLQGIGEVKSIEIVEGRPYSDVYELKKVIGDDTFENVKKFIEI